MGHEEDRATHPGGRQRGFGAGMAAANDYNIIFINELHERTRFAFWAPMIPENRSQLNSVSRGTPMLHCSIHRWPSMFHVEQSLADAEAAENLP
jgi:hypothetical protein